MLEKGGLGESSVVVLSRLGWKDEKITYGAIPTLELHELGKPPFCLIVPAKLHHIEDEYLKIFAI